MTQAKGPGESPLLLLDVIKLLDRLQIPYAVVGALAASFYGVIRMSVDADAVVSLRSTGADIQALVMELRKSGLRTTQARGDMGDPIGAVLKVEDGFENRVDLLMDIRGVGEEVFSRTVEAKVAGKPVRLVGVEDFIAMKIFAGSPKDIADVAGVLKVSGKKINKALLKKLVQGYGKAASRKLESLR